MTKPRKTAEIILFPLERRLRRPALSASDLRTVEALYDRQDATGAWRGFAAIGSAAVILFTSYDRCSALTLRRDTAGAYELAAADGQVVRRGTNIGQVLHLFAGVVAAEAEGR